LSLKDAELYKLGHASSFHYLNQSRTFDLEGTNNEDGYWKTKRAMDIVGITRKDLIPNRTLAHLRCFLEKYLP
jgi:myosin heavy subunit